MIDISFSLPSILLKQLYKCQTSLIPQDALSTYRNITRTIRT